MAKSVIALFLVFTLFGCAQTPKKAAEPTLSWESNQERLKQIKNWRVNGRLIANDGSQGGSANFNWNQRDKHYDIHLFGPFGAGAVELSGSPTLVTLTQGNQRQSARTPEALLKNATGIEVPINSLQYWALGIPSPHAEAGKIEHLENGYIKTLVQQGWTVHYDSYQSVSSLLLPKKVSMTKPPYKVRIVFRNWSL